MTLVDGQPQTGQAAYGQYSYYQFHMGGGKLKSALTVSLTPSSGGDLDLFLVFGPPNAENARRGSLSSFGFDSRSANASSSMSSGDSMGMGLVGSASGQGYTGPRAEYQPGVDRYADNSTPH